MITVMGISVNFIKLDFAETTAVEKTQWLGLVTITELQVGE